MWSIHVTTLNIYLYQLCNPDNCKSNLLSFQISIIYSSTTYSYKKITQKSSLLSLSSTEIHFVVQTFDSTTEPSFHFRILNLQTPPFQIPSFSPNSNLGRAGPGILLIPSRRHGNSDVILSAESSSRVASFVLLGARWREQKEKRQGGGGGPYNEGFCQFKSCGLRDWSAAPFYTRHAFRGNSYIYANQHGIGKGVAREKISFFLFCFQAVSEDGAISRV